MFFNKLIKRLIKIIIVLIIALIFINILLMSCISTQSTDFTSSTHYDQLLKAVDSYGELLKSTTEKVASNEKIMMLLEENVDVNNFKEDDKNLMKEQIELFEGILKTISYIKTINIISLKGEYLFSNEILYENFDIRQRPWFKDEYLYNFKDSIITDIHKDFSTGKYTISILKFIYSTDENELLGVAILDIFIEDLLMYIENSFYLGTLNAYIDMGNDEYLANNGMKYPKTKLIDNELVYSGTAFDNKINIIFSFNKNSMIFNKQIKQVNNIISLILILVGITLSLIITRILRIIFKPVENSLEKLKVLLINLEKNNFNLELADEIQQLEFISESLSKSFDKKIQSLIYYDELTSLPNRKMLFNLTSTLIKNNKEFALLFIDLNRFKYVNDIFGHTVGDNLLICFSNILKELFKEKGTVTRYSGDEFVIIYDKFTNNKELINFYNTVVLSYFEKPIYFANNNILVEFSAGVAVYPRDGENIDDLIRKSDFMMYSNKKNNENNELLFFNNEIYNNIKRVEDIKFELKNAIKKNELSLYYQPIVDNNKAIKKVEALLRWKNEKFGFVSPGDFINYAEDIGEIIPIGYWIIEEVCKNFNGFCNNNSLQISINVSPIQLMDFEFAYNVKEILDKYDMNYSNLCFEITESVVLDESIIVYDNIHLLHKMGLKIALDDFGTGYAAFSYLRKYKLDILKIDKIFIDNSQDKYFNIIENIKNIAHILDMKVVIEGVETELQFDKLNQVGCDYFQGYHFSKPITLDELKDLLL